MIHKDILTVGGEAWGTQTGAQERRALHHTHLVVEALGQKGVEDLTAALDDDRLEVEVIELVEHIAERSRAEMQPMVGDIGEAATTVEHHRARVAAREAASGKLRSIVDEGLRAYEDSVLLGAPHVRESRLPRLAEPIGLVGSRSHIAIGRLSPFEDDIRAMLLDERKKAPVEPAALVVQDTPSHIDARVLEDVEAAAVDQRVGVVVGADDTRDAGLHHEVGTRRGVAVMAARLEIDIERCVLSQDGSVGQCEQPQQSVAFGMERAILLMEALGHHPTLFDHHTAHQRVGADMAQTVGGQLEAAGDIKLVVESHRED